MLSLYVPSFAAFVALVQLAQGAIMPEISVDVRSLTKRQILTGQATTYGGNTQGGACSFTSYTLPSGLYGTALSSSNWDTSGNCGGCISVTGSSGKTITAMVRQAAICLYHPLCCILTKLYRVDHRRMPRLRRKPSRPLPRCLSSSNWRHKRHLFLSLIHI